MRNNLLIELPYVIVAYIWVCASLEMHAVPYWSEYSKTRLLLHTVTSSKYFDLAIAGVIGINVVTMAMEYYMMPRVIRQSD